MSDSLLSRKFDCFVVTFISIHLGQEQIWMLFSEMLLQQYLGISAVSLFNKIIFRVSPGIIINIYGFLYSN